MDYHSQFLLHLILILYYYIFSQDTWIYHSKYQPDKTIINKCDYGFGQPGCDNKIAYVITQHGYICYNEPWNIKSYHNHKTQVRNYTIKDIVSPPWLKLELNV